MTLLVSSSTWLKLANRVAIVTGAGSGIGASVAYHLAQQGCHVVLADKDMEAASDSASACSAFTRPSPSCLHPPKILAVQCDVADSSSVQHLIATSDEFARQVHQHELQRDTEMNCTSNLIDSMFVDAAPLASILINCAGITRDAVITKMTDADFDEVVDINLRGTYLTCRYFSQLARLEALSTTNSATTSSIINLSSIVGLRGNKGQTNYAASKAGVIGMTKSLAKELAKYNVRANCIVPGFIDTPMSAKMPENIRQTMKSNIPMKKFGTTENVSDLILFLASERAAYITGEAIEISGAISF